MVSQITLIDGRLVHPQKNFDGKLDQFKDIVSEWVDEARREPDGLERLNHAFAEVTRDSR